MSKKVRFKSVHVLLLIHNPDNMYMIRFTNHLKNIWDDYNIIIIISNTVNT